MGCFLPGQFIAYSRFSRYLLAGLILLIAELSRICIVHSTEGVVWVLLAPPGIRVTLPSCIAVGSGVVFYSDVLYNSCLEALILCLKHSQYAYYAGLAVHARAKALGR